MEVETTRRQTGHYESRTAYSDKPYKTFVPKPLPPEPRVAMDVALCDLPWTDKLWIYDLRTNKHFTLKTNPLRPEHLTDFVSCFNPPDRHDRRETECFKVFTYDELMKRDKISLDIFWLKDDSLEDSANLPAPEVLALDITENLEAALGQFGSIYESLSAIEV